MPPINGEASKTNGLPPQPLHHKSSSLTIAEQNEQYAEARITFDKTIRGHYRDGKAGYAHVGVLFLTWEADDLHCNATEVDSLNKMFEEEFLFETEAFQIPSKKSSTALMATVAAFCMKYDSPDCLAIIYYAGHGYPGQETGSFKLAAKVNGDADGDPRVFFNDIEACLRAPDCDQLVIIDCCYSARAFARHHIGRRKFELLTSTAHDRMSDAPGLPESFTQTLNEVLRDLLKQNPRGFSTSHLFREIYHRIPHKKPLHFDQSRHSYGKIWLRPQGQPANPSIDEGEPIYLKLDLKLNKPPEGAVINELASSLQFLPHVDEIKVKEIWAPRKRISDFMRFVWLVQRLRPFVTRIQEKRLKMKRKFQHIEGEGIPESVKRLQKQSLRKHESLYDWSSAQEHKRRKSFTWPIVPVHESNNSAVID